MPQLYTPFIAQAGKVAGQAMAQQGQNELIQSAYMGKPGALEQLMSVNPQAAQQIKTEKTRKDQAALQTERYEEKQGIASEDRKIKAQAELRKIKDDVVSQISGMSSFKEAKSFYDQKLSENADLLKVAEVDMGQAQLTEQIFNQMKGDQSKQFEGKGMEAQTSNMLVKGVKDPAFRDSPEYARAYQLATEPKIVKTATGDILMPVNLPPIFLAPGEEMSDADQIKEIKAKSERDVKYIPGTRKPIKYTEGEKLASGFYDRMQNSKASIEALGDYDPTDAKEVALGLSNVTATPNMQMYKQASGDWIRAKLRKESGAVIADQEMASEYAIYFPRLGDSKEVIVQKARARKVAEESMKKNAGTMVKERKSGTPKAGDVVGGYKFKGGDPSKQENWEIQ